MAVIGQSRKRQKSQKTQELKLGSIEKSLFNDMSSSGFLHLFALLLPIIYDYPTYDELMQRFKEESNGGQGVSDEEMAIIHQPYYTSQNTYPPRYYQRIAINRTVDAIAKGQDRLLLVMATGTGKTYTAFQIVYRLLKAGMKKKILYLADRNILVDQSIQQDFGGKAGYMKAVKSLEDAIYEVA